MTSEMSLASRKPEGVMPTKSKKLEGLLKELSGLSKQYDKIFRRAKEIIPEILKQGKEDGFTDLQIGDMLRGVAPEVIGLSPRQLRDLLPATAKHQEKVRAPLPHHSHGKQLVAPTVNIVKPESEPEQAPAPEPEQFAAEIAAKPAAADDVIIPVQQQPPPPSKEEYNAELVKGVFFAKASPYGPNLHIIIPKNIIASLPP